MSLLIAPPVGADVSPRRRHEDGDDDAVEETITVTLPLISHDEGITLTFVAADFIEPDASVHVEARGENSIFGVSELVYAALTVAHEAFMEKAEFEAEKETYSSSVEKSIAEMHFAPRPIAVTGAPKKKPGPTRVARFAKSAADYTGVSTVRNGVSTAVRRMFSGRTPCETFVNCAVIAAACGYGGFQLHSAVQVWNKGYALACSPRNSGWLTSLIQTLPVVLGLSHGPCAAFLAANEYVIDQIRNMLSTPLQYAAISTITMGAVAPSTLHALFRGARYLSGAALTGLSRTVCAPLVATGLVQRAPPRSDADQEEPPTPPEEGDEDDDEDDVHVHENSGRRFSYNKKTKQVTWIDPPRAEQIIAHERAQQEASRARLATHAPVLPPPVVPPSVVRQLLRARGREPLLPRYRV